MDVLEQIYQTYKGRSEILTTEVNYVPSFLKTIEHRTITIKRTYHQLTTRDDIYHGYAYANLRIEPIAAITRATLNVARNSLVEVQQIEACYSHRLLGEGTPCEFFLMSGIRCLPAYSDSIYMIQIETEEDVSADQAFTISYDVVVPIRYPKAQSYRFVCSFQHLGYLGTIGRAGEHKMKVELRYPTVKLYFFLPPDAHNPVLILDHFYKVPLEKVNTWFELNFTEKRIVDMDEVQTASLKFYTDTTNFVCNILSICKDRYHIYNGILLSTIYDKRL